MYIHCWVCQHYDYIDEDTGLCKMDGKIVSARCDACERFADDEEVRQ